MLLISRACSMRLLAVAHLDAELLQLEHHRQLDDVDAERHVGDAFVLEHRLDLARRAAEQLAVAADGAAQAEQAGLAVVLAQPRRVEAVVLGGRAEVPDVRVAVAGEERIARELVARPFADHRARRVADVVLVEAEQRAEARAGERLARARQPVVVQAAEVDALLEVDLHVAGSLQRPRPVVVRVDVLGPDDPRLALLLGRQSRLRRGRAAPLRSMLRRRARGLDRQGRSAAGARSSSRRVDRCVSRSSFGGRAGAPLECRGRTPRNAGGGVRRGGGDF